MRSGWVVTRLEQFIDVKARLREEMSHTNKNTYSPKAEQLLLEVENMREKLIEALEES